ncbi:C4-dicarboxylate ABC transporter substrate-binding protein [Alteromonas mediterranea]|uniref:C4-dicarboxylate ABC transporter substrate-binding protein n=1 Tax=Alteromonas mediterranea TaxID=314275 RepID=A0AAC9JEU3_9ALTE|nr:TRAP transporter substrate-binding protein [Alteromonas mediterranea]APD90268.1 C4-dicarboxylate ABC transporter substrate-binding protein [Alteromonas mediterranea]
MLRYIKLTVSATLMMLTSACSQNELSGDVTVLRLGHALDTQHTVHKAMEYLGERLNYYSDGTMSVVIYPSSQLGTEREMVELLQIGSLAMTKVSASPLEGFAPEMKIFSIPYIFRDNDHFWRVLNSELGDELLSGIENFRLKGLGYYDAGSRSFYTNDKPITHPSDLNGLKIRVLNSPTAVATVRALGGAATPVSWGELYTALQQGVVEGAENNPPSYYLSRHYEIARYYSLDEHTSVPDVMLASLPVWESLNEQQQRWLTKAMEDSVEYQRELWKASTLASLEKVKAEGVTVITPNKAPFVEAVKPFHKSFEDTPIGDLITQIKAM